MTKNQVNIERTYVSPLRKEQAVLTKARISGAAYDLFLAKGYVATTMAQVAAAAGVSAQTVYNAHGSKASLLKAVYDVRLIGDDEPIPMFQRSDVIALYALEDPRELLHAYATLGMRLLLRIGPLLAMIFDGAATGDPDLHALVETTGTERLAGASGTVRRLVELDALDARMTAERARDIIWTLNSFQVWDLLVQTRGWTPEEYADWVGKSMADSVLRST